MLKLSCMCECLGVQITRENQRASLFQTLGFFICYWELPSYYIHTQDHTNPFRYILHYHLESWLNYSGVSWSCHSSECLEVQFTWANEKGILFATLISGILVSFWELPSYYIYTPYDPHPFTSTAFTLSFRSKSHLFKRALRLSFMRVFRGSSNHSKSKGILLQTIQVAKLFL